MVDVRSCTRPPRSHDQQHISEYPHKFTPSRSHDQLYISEYPHTYIPPRSPDQTYISECTQPKSHCSTSVGEFSHHCVSCVLYI